MGFSGCLGVDALESVPQFFQVANHTGLPFSELTAALTISVDQVENYGVEGFGKIRGIVVVE